MKCNSIPVGRSDSGAMSDNALFVTYCVKHETADGADSKFVILIRIAINTTLTASDKDFRYELHRARYVQYSWPVTQA